MNHAYSSRNDELDAHPVGGGTLVPSACGIEKVSVGAVMQPSLQLPASIIGTTTARTPTACVPDTS